MTDRPDIRPSRSDPEIWSASGEWTLPHATRLLDLVESAPARLKDIDGRDISRLDSTGAMLLSRFATRAGLGLATVEVKPLHQPIIEAVRELCEAAPRDKRRDHGFRRMLGKIGFAMEDYYTEVRALVGFLGLTLVTALGVLLHPRRFRLTPTVHHMEQVGLDAVPLIALLSFMIGAVVAFLGATVLRDFGAEVFVVDLVSISFLREFAVLMTAIVLAGRTASAFTAQIGAMQSGEEIDAIRTLGLDPIELLVLPRLFALMLMLPLLTFIAMLAGLLGGLVVGAGALDISPEAYLVRTHETIELRHFLVGLSKAPLFAIVISLIGCLEGFQVQGTAESVGERTTSSVVQAISMVILLDAFAALWFMEMDW